MMIAGWSEPTRRRAFVMVYAVGTLVLVSSLALSLIESTGADVDVCKQRMYMVLARSAAESGIEYAMAFVTRQLGKGFDPSNNVKGGPWTDPNFDGGAGANSVFEPGAGTIVYPWFYAVRASQKPLNPNFTTINSQAEGFPVRLHQIDLSGNPVAGAPIAQVMQFQISMTPEPTYQNVHNNTINDLPTNFTIRSRGEVLQNLGAGPVVLASAYVMQTFMVPRADTCPNAPRPLRQVFDREPQTLTPGPFVPAAGALPATRDSTLAPIPGNYHLLTPNPH